MSSRATTPLNSLIGVITSALQSDESAVLLSFEIGVVSSNVSTSGSTIPLTIVVLYFNHSIDDFEYWGVSATIPIRANSFDRPPRSLMAYGQRCTCGIGAGLDR